MSTSSEEIPSPTISTTSFIIPLSPTELETGPQPKENQIQVNVDPQCIQEALRMFFQPVKNNDPKLDFYTMYKRETTEYDSEYINKCSEDLNTTLIFAGLFSAVSSAFVIAVQPELQPDPGQRSEAYLRAILLSLNPSISPGENPTAPLAWGGPPQGIIATLSLLYASLLSSLLAAFVAMLGKQWLTRYLRNTGKSMIERCGDRQRKFDGLHRWPFRVFLGSIPLMLQIALFLLACGLSRYMWSVDASVARVVISFTVLTFLLYIGIVVAGISSYECPFQTPASVALRCLRDSGIVGKILTSLSPSNIINPLPWVCSALVNAQRRLVRGVRRFRRRTLLPVVARGTALLPIVARGMANHPLVPQDGPGLRLHVRDLESLQQQNGDDARCVSWVLRDITEPEAIDSAIRLAVNIRWFSGNSTHEPPFDLIIPIFEACFDSTGELYHGMRDRAYFSAQAIFQIHMRARVQSDEEGLRYPLPVVSLSSFDPTDRDLHHIMHMFESNSVGRRPTFHLPDIGAHTHTFSIWLSNLFVDLTNIGQNPSLNSYKCYLGVAVTNNQALIADILLMWYMFLGGRVEEETFWVVDKSDSLEDILSHLSMRVVNLIAEGRCPKHLHYLLEFLAAWGERPLWLTPMAYEWCSTIAEAAERFDPGNKSQPQLLPCSSPRTSEEEFSQVGPLCDIFRLGNSFPRASELPQILPPTKCLDLLPLTLRIGFRLVGNVASALRLNHTPHHNLAFEAAFSSDDDEMIADVVSVWIADSAGIPPGSVARYLSRRVEITTPFSPRLLRVSTRVFERVGRSELFEIGPETVRLLNRLRVDLDGTVPRRIIWGRLLVSVIRSPAGLEGLSLHHWRLLDDLLTMLSVNFMSRDVEVMRSLEVAENWEKLEVWMVVIWKSIPAWTMPTPRSMQSIEQATLKLLLQQPSAIPRFKVLCGDSDESDSNEGRLRRVCNEALAARSGPEPLPRSSSETSMRSPPSSLYEG